jgi:hypothetical protein
MGQVTLWCARLRAAAHAAWRYARSAPGTYQWLTVLLATTILLQHVDPALRHTFLVHRSTNLHELERRPVRALIDSALYIDGPSWWPYLVLYTVFHAPAERWLGTGKWLLIAATAHVAATYISEGDLYWLINHALAPASERRALDVGVSYALAGTEAVLAYKLVPRWRAPYAAALLAYHGAPLLWADRTFTDVGHFSAALIGFACYPLAAYTFSDGRPHRSDYPLLDPAAALRTLINTLRTRAAHRHHDHRGGAQPATTLLRPPRRTSGPRDRRRPDHPGGP